MSYRVTAAATKNTHYFFPISTLFLCFYGHFNLITLVLPLSFISRDPGRIEEHMLFFPIFAAEGVTILEKVEFLHFLQVKWTENGVD